MQQLCRQWILIGMLLTAPLTGCASPYYADRGAAFGGLTGAGVGAIVGEALGEPLAGAAIGTGVGAVTGAAAGQSLDEIEARNRAAIAEKVGRSAARGTVRISDVVEMSAAGVDEEIIVSHLRRHGLSRPLRTDDLIHLQNNGVSSRVVQAMQKQQSVPPTAENRTDSRPVVVREHVYHEYHDPCWGHHPGWYHGHHSPRVSWGLSFSSD